MRKLLMIFVAVVFVFQSVEAQNELKATTPETLFDKYGSLENAIYKMTREEWDVMRTWEGYSDELAAQIITEHRAENERTKEKLGITATRTTAMDDCNCWVEPDDTYTQISSADWNECAGGGVDVDCWFGPVSLEGWSFNLYGETYNSFYLTSKGTISFGSGYIDWVPQEFPGATYEQIAGFWADSDFRQSGELWYKVTEDAVYVNFLEVGYWNNQGDKTNTFQIIFTPDENDFLPGDDNVQLCYESMNWSHGQVGGNGCSGPTPAIVGADRSSTGEPGIQFGAFNSCSFDYDGPYGNADGAYWLNDKVFTFSTADVSSNIAPIPTASFACDTIVVCINDTLDLSMEFLSPESDQTTTITVLGGDDGLTYTATAGSPASLDAIFVGTEDNVGIHEITITGTDNGDPAGESSLELVIEVLNVVLPPLTLTADTWTLCAGEEVWIEASEGFDSYTWNPGGCTGNTCLVGGAGGDIVVQGILDVGCIAENSNFLDVTPPFLPDISIVPPVICDGGTAIVTVTEEDVVIESVEWNADWLGLGGDVLNFSDDEPFTAEVIVGTYQLLATDSTGCTGQRIFNVDEATSLLPEDIWSGAYCEGLEQIVLDGAQANPEAGELIMYLSSNNDNGWGGSYIEVTIWNADDSLGTTTTSIETTFESFEIFSVPIEFGQDICVTYTSADETLDEFNGLTLFNCSSGNLVYDGDVFPGEIWCGTADCEFSDLEGTWTVTADGDFPGTGNLSSYTTFNTTYTPTSYGWHQVCFQDENCPSETCYEFEITLTPDISIAGDELLLCGGETGTVTAVIDDIGGTGNVDWPAPGTDGVGVTSNDYSFNSSQNIDSQVTITNGCGSASADILIQAQMEPAPQIDDITLCEGGEVPLDPISPDYEDDVYEWTLNDFQFGDGEFDQLVTQSGEYCVEVSNDCFPQGVEDCAIVSIAAEAFPAVPNPWVECENETTPILAEFLPEGWTIEWPDGSTGEIYTVGESGVVVYNITDPGDCETHEFNTTVFIGEAPNINPAPTSTIILCPGVPEPFSVNADTFIDTYTWTYQCDGETQYLAGDDDLTVSSDAFPPECWGQTVEIVGTAANPCGSQTAVFPIEVNACDIVAFNVFSPNNDGSNQYLEFDGLENYSNVKLAVFNRWGNVVYESEDYENKDWQADDVESGTYYYVLELPNGKQHSGTISIFKQE